MAQLKMGLRGLPPQAEAEILADYETHFADGLAAGRSEEDVAERLGDPLRLARELRAEAVLRRWEGDRSPSGAAAAVFAVLGLGALDILIMLPIILGIGGALFGFGVAALGVFVCGGAVFAVGPFSGMPGGPPAAIFLGLGLMTGAVALAAVVAILTIALVNALVWYARLHYRVLKPAFDPSSAGGVL
jgi:uncharacterized membrane protein